MWGLKVLVLPQSCYRIFSSGIYLVTSEETGLKPAAACLSQRSVGPVQGGVEPCWAAKAPLGERTESCPSAHFLPKPRESCQSVRIRAHLWVPLEAWLSAARPGPAGVGFRAGQIGFKSWHFPPNTFKSVLFTPHPPSSDLAFSSNYIIPCFCFQTSLCTSVRSAFLSERLFCAGLESPGVLWACFVPLVVRLHWEACFFGLFALSSGWVPCSWHS